MVARVVERATGKPVAVILRPGKTPDGAEVALVLRHVIRRIRARWPRVRILLRADSGFAREALMAWCEANRVDFVFGLARNARLVEEISIDLAWAASGVEQQHHHALELGGEDRPHRAGRLHGDLVAAVQPLHGDAQMHFAMA